MKNTRILILVIILIGVALLAHQYMTSSETDSPTEEVTTPVESTTTQPEENNTSEKLTTFSNETLGLSFTYPASYGNLDFQIRDGSDSGRQFHGSFEKTDLWFGGVTPDFAEGRGAGFTDYSGEPNWYDDKPVVKTINVKGGSIKIIKGTGKSMPGNNLIGGQYGALLQLKGNEFKGAAFATDNSLEEFESVLKTIVLK